MWLGQVHVAQNLHFKRGHHFLNPDRYTLPVPKLFINLSFTAAAALSDRSCVLSSFTGEKSEAQRREVTFPRAHGKEVLWSGFEPRPVLMVCPRQDELKNKILKTHLPSEHSGASLPFNDALPEFQSSADHTFPVNNEQISHCVSKRSSQRPH